MANEMMRYNNINLLVIKDKYKTMIGVMYIVSGRIVLRKPENRS